MRQCLGWGLKHGAQGTWCLAIPESKFGFDGPEDPRVLVVRDVTQKEGLCGVGEEEEWRCLNQGEELIEQEPVATQSIGPGGWPKV